MVTLSLYQMLLLLIGLMGLLHTLTLIEKNKLQRCVDEEEYVPFRNIYVQANSNSNIARLVTTSLNTFEASGISVASRHSQNGITIIEYITGSQIIIIDYNNTRLGALPKENIEQYSHHIFFDNELPDSAIRAIIHNLGLDGYMVSIGICTERSVKNGEKDE